MAPSTPEQKALHNKHQILNAHRKWLSKLGGNRYHPLLFVYLKEALDEVHSEISAPCDLSDLCLLQKPKKPSAFVTVKQMREFYNQHHPVGGNDEETRTTVSEETISKSTAA